MKELLTENKKVECALWFIYLELKYQNEIQLLRLEDTTNLDIIKKLREQHKETSEQLLKDF